MNFSFNLDDGFEFWQYVKNSFLCFLGIEIVDKSNIFYYIEFITSSIFAFVYFAIIVKEFLKP